MQQLREVILHIAASEDGFIATLDDGLDWLPTPNETQDFGMNAFMDTIDCVLIGRRTWEIALTLEEHPFANFERHIFSHATGEATHIVEELKKRNGLNIWLLGGGILNASLLKAKLVDEVVITTIPITLQKGIPIFGPLGTTIPEEWKLKKTVHYTDHNSTQETWRRQ